jgi:hypothetical protein
MKSNDQFSFEISLSVLNHLGRNLYRNFMTVLGEAVSNSWDADAQNVWIYIDRKNNSLIIKDDGKGMKRDDFQDKFLKIGYSKRKDGETRTASGRPFIGRKGIGKLALLSCAARITVLSKVLNDEYVGGLIDNSSLTQAITDDLTPSEYVLGQPDSSFLENYTNEHIQGTIIYFDDINNGIRNRVDYIKKLVALYFRFSLLDDKFSIFVDDEKITYAHLDSLANKTQFLWAINGIDDPYIKESLSNRSSLKVKKKLDRNIPIKGFIASVEKPLDLKVISTDERVSIDLFVNGRLREKNLLKHISKSRIVENYLYGQIHFDELDGEKDRFTSSREGIIADDPKFKELQGYLESILATIIEDWDEWRVKLNKDGDSDNKRISKKERKSRELYNTVAEDYLLPKESSNQKKVSRWVDELANDAQYNFSSYAECFISENLVRKYVQDKKFALSPEAQKEIDKWKKREAQSKNKGNISIDIRQSNSDLGYLSMTDLANLVDKRDLNKEASLARDANEFKPMRDAVAHTSLLTDIAKNRLTMVYENVKSRIRILLSK